MNREQNRMCKTNFGLQEEWQTALFQSNAETDKSIYQQHNDCHDVVFLKKETAALSN